MLINPKGDKRRILAPHKILSQILLERRLYPRLAIHGCELVALLPGRGPSLGATC